MHHKEYYSILLIERELKEIKFYREHLRDKMGKTEEKYYIITQNL